MCGMSMQLLEKRGAFAEAVKGQKNVWKVKIIEVGAGSSAYYTETVLSRDLATAFPIGTKSFADHATWEEKMERPERSVEDIVGKTVTVPEYDPTTKAAYVNIMFSEKFAPFVEEFYDALGMSISAYGETEEGTVDDYVGRVAVSILPSPLNSIDVVTAAGAGGAIMEKLSESYKRLEEDGAAGLQLAKETSKEKENMEIAELATRVDALAESIETLAGTVSSFVESVKPVDAPVGEPDIAAVAEAVAVSELPAEGRLRVYEAIKTSGIAVEDAIASEKQYVEAIKASIEAAAPLTESFGASAPSSTPDFTVGAWK